jgi:hypothetical protein
MWDSPGTSGASVHAESVWARYRAIAGEDAFERLTRHKEAVAGALAPTPLRA